MARAKTFRRAFEPLRVVQDEFLEAFGDVSMTGLLHYELGCVEDKLERCQSLLSVYYRRTSRIAGHT